MKLNIGVITGKLTKGKHAWSKFHFFLKPISLILALVLLSSHDLYLKMGTYFLQANHEATLSLYNGTFEKSENLISRDRMLDASIVAHGKKVALNPALWKDQDTTITQITFNTGEAGTYVAGVSTKARNLALSAEDFNGYLEHDGVLDMLEERTNNNQLDQDAVESYQKHVKAIFQVGDLKTDDWKTVLGYPIEFVPQVNPYEKYTGENLEVQLLIDGEPLPNQLVYADYIRNPNAHSHTESTHEHNGMTHSHDHDNNDHSHADGSHSEEGHTHTSGQQLRTDTQGMVSVNLPEDGTYYLRTIHMVSVNGENELTHRSKWATLSFEVTHNHDTSTHTHEDHENEGGIPTWGFVLGSVLIIGLLFFMFRNKNS